MESENSKFLKLLMQYWQPSRISFKLDQNGLIGLYRDDDSLLYSDETFDKLITKVRLYFSIQLMEDAIKKIKE